SVVRSADGLGACCVCTDIGGAISTMMVTKPMAHHVLVTSSMTATPFFPRITFGRIRLTSGRSPRGTPQTRRLSVLRGGSAVVVRAPVFLVPGEPHPTR